MKRKMNAGDRTVTGLDSRGGEEGGAKYLQRNGGRRGCSSGVHNKNIILSVGSCTSL